MELEEHESLFRDWARRTLRFSSKQFDTLLQYTHDALNDPKRATVPANLASHPIPLAYCLAYLQANASCSELASRPVTPPLESALRGISRTLGFRISSFSHDGRLADLPMFSELMLQCDDDLATVNLRLLDLVVGQSRLCLDLLGSAQCEDARQQILNVFADLNTLSGVVLEQLRGK